MDFLRMLVWTVVVSAIAAEFTELAPWLAGRLVDAAVRRLPEPLRQRYGEEWHTELSAVPGKVTKLGWAVQVVVRAEWTGRELLGTSGGTSERIGRAWTAVLAAIAAARADAARARRGFSTWHAEAPPGLLDRVTYVAGRLAELAQLAVRWAGRAVLRVTEPIRAQRRRAAVLRTDAERIGDIASLNGESPAEVLREVADFRLALDTNLLIAAAAADAGDAVVVAESVEGERAELVAFQDRLLDRLAEAAGEVSSRPGRSRRFRRRPSS